MKDASTPAEALKFVVEHLGSQSAMARLLRVSQPSVWEWLNKGKALPAKHVRTVEKAIEADTGISRYDLRPDLFVRGGHDGDLAPASAIVACDRNGFPHRGDA